MLKLKKEKFTGKYDGVTPAILLPQGGISDGLNMRKVSAVGGWKVRKGCATHNTTAIAAVPILSLHQYAHPRNLDYHFIAQCNAKLTDAANDPPANGTAFGTDITNSKTISSSAPGYSDMIGEKWVYTDGGVPLTWGGATPFCSGFLAWDNSEAALSDFTKQVTDNRTDTEGLILGAASDYLIVISPEKASAITLDLGTAVNTNAVTAAVASYQAGTWSDRSATDGTAAAGKTLAVDGSLTWAVSSSDTLGVFGGIMGYAYKVTFSGALSNSVTVKSCKVVYGLSQISNKWDGVYRTPLAIVFFDQSTGEYVDLTGKLTIESESMYLNLNDATTSDFIYVKSEVPLAGLGFGVVEGYENTDAAVFDSVEYWDGDSWNALTTNLTDETKSVAGTASLAQSGTLWWVAAGLVVHRRSMPFDSLPGFWYRVSWSAAFANAADDVRVFFVACASHPEELSSYAGVVEFKGRAMYWGDPSYPNRLRFSENERPDAVLEQSKSYTDAFGNMTKIVRAVRFYNELLVFKPDSVWLLEGYTLANFGILKVADTIGCCAPKTVCVVEAGYLAMHADEPLSICIWMDTDGIYVIDGRKPRKVSGPIDHYFNTEYSTAISAANLVTAQAFVDPLRNEYHLLVADGTELVYNYITDEWYPPWNRTVGGASAKLVSGISFRDTNKQYQTYGGNTAGKVFRLETDTSDKDDSNADVLIAHNIKTRAICYEVKDSYQFDLLFRGLYAEMKTRSSGDVVITFYKDLASSGSALATPAAISLANSGYGLTVDGVDTSQQRCSCFQLKFAVATVDVELEIYSFLYYMDVEGEKGF
jgi:hypothetical protein